MAKFNRASALAIILGFSSLLVVGIQGTASAHHAAGHTGGPGTNCDQPRDARYPPGQCARAGVGASETTVEVGQGFRFHGEGYAPGTSVTITLYSKPVVLGKANVDRFTFFQTLITIPVGTAPGAHRLVASGTGVDGAPLSLGTAITVVAPGVVAPGGGSGLGGTTGDAGSRGPIFGVTLPRTGTDAAIVGALGVVLVAVGGATIAASRRRAS